MATTTTSSSVAAFFTTEAQATEAISALKGAGFSSNQIGAATSASSHDESMSNDGYTSATGTSATGTAAHNLGAKTEGMWGKVKNFFEGNESTEGGVEQYADERSRDGASHEVTNRDTYGYEAGDVSHSLEGMSLSDQHTRHFENRFNAGHSGVLVTVTAPGRENEAATILEQNGGDLGQNSDAREMDTTTAAAPVAPSGQQRIQLLGEVLRVHTDRVSRGEVRIRKEIRTEQQTVQVPVSHEELVIERIPVSGTTAVHGAIGEDSEIRIPLSEERASLDKQTVVREEVGVGKRAIEGTEQLSGSVRHEELEVEEKPMNETKRGL